MDRICGRDTGRNLRSPPSRLPRRCAPGPRRKWQGTPCAESHLHESLEQTVVTRGHQLLIGRSLEQVATQLFPGELIEGKITVEGVDHVIAVRRGGVVLVSMVPDGAGKADQIQPVGGHSFAILGSGEKIVNPVVHHLVERSPVLDEGPHFFRTRRKTGQVEVKATNQGYSVSIRRRFQLLFLELGENEPVDPMVRPFLARSRDGGFPSGARRPNIFHTSPLRESTA